jgi:hypothetical protein
MCAGSVRLTRRYHRLCLASLFATAATASRSPSNSFMALGSRCKHRPWIAARVSEQLCRPPNARDTEVSADLATSVAPELSRRDFLVAPAGQKPHRRQGGVEDVVRRLQPSGCAKPSAAAEGPADHRALASQSLQDPFCKSQPCLRVPQRQGEDLYAEEHRTAREPCGMNSPVFQGIVGDTDGDGEVVQSEQHPSV